MSYELLCKKIISISEEIERLIDDKDESICPSLLSERLKLLEELKLLVDDTKGDASYKENQDKLNRFLLDIQQRDKRYINFIQKEIFDLLRQSDQQVKGKKAIKAYRSNLL